MNESEGVAFPQPLVVIPAFEGKEIRALERDGDIWFPFMDIANAWGIDRSTPDNIINRNSEVFEGLSTSVFDVTSNAVLRCLNERGMYLMMGKVTAGRAKNKDARAAIIRFQKWYPELIQKYRKGTIQSQLPDPDPIEDALDRNAKYRKRLIEQYDFKPDEATVICLGLVQKDTGVSFHKPAVISHSETGWMNPTDLGRECGLTGEQVNQWLYNHKLQYPTWNGQIKIWRLTAEGEVFGEEYPMELSNKHSEIRIRWHKSVKDFAPGIKRAAEQAAIIVA